MILHREQWILGVSQAFDSLIIQIHVGDLGFPLQGVHVYAESVVLCGDFYFPSLHIHYWMVAAAVSELEFIRLPTEREPHNLVSQTDTKHRRLPDESGNILSCIGYGIRVPWAVRKKDTVRVESKYLRSRGRGWDYSHATTRCNKVPQNVELDTKVIGDNKKKGLGMRGQGLALPSIPFFGHLDPVTSA